MEEEMEDSFFRHPQYQQHQIVMKLENITSTYGCAYDSVRRVIYATDYNKNTVKAFNLEGHQIGTIFGRIFGQSDEARKKAPIKCPVAVYVDDPTGEVIVGSGDSNVVHVMSPDGSHLHSYGGESNRSLFRRPWGGAPVRTADGEYFICVADRLNAAVRVFKRHLTHQERQIKHSHMHAPHGICAYQRGILVVCKSSGTLPYFSLEGERLPGPLDDIALIPEQLCPPLKSPHSVAVDRLGRIAVADTGNSRVVVFMPRCGAPPKLLLEFSMKSFQPMSVAIGPEDSLVVADYSNSTVWMVRPWYALNTWSPQSHATMPLETREQVETLMVINTVLSDIPLGLLPPELMYQIFNFLAGANSAAAMSSTGE